MLRSRLVPRLKPRVALCGLFAAAALVLTACGGSSTTTVITTGATPTTPATSTTATTSPTTSTATSTTSTGASTTSDLRQAFDNALRTNLVQQRGLSNQQADCVLNELQKTLPDSQIQATISGQVPKAVTEAAFKAGLKCANQ
jgi:hypothetical protein